MRQQAQVDDNPVEAATVDEILGTARGETTNDAARRVVRERDELRETCSDFDKRCAELERRTVPVCAPRQSERKTVKPKIVCLCGSTRFYREFQRANYEETMAGRIVLSVGFFMHASEDAHGETWGCTSEQKIALDELHLRKIDLADESPAGATMTKRDTPTSSAPSAGAGAG